MPHRPVGVALACLVALSSCSDTPTQPSTKSDGQSAPEFAWISNSWIAKRRMLSGRQNHAAGVVNNSAGQPVLYVFGGATSQGSNATTIVAYNYGTNSWATKSARIGRSYLNGVGVIGDKLYLAGGAVETQGVYQYQMSLLVYDPAADRLIRKADMPRALAGGISAVIGGKLYVFSGACPGCTPRVSRRLYRYDPVTNVWSSLLSAPRGHALGVSGVIDGKLYVAGGYGEDESVTAAVDVYDPVRNRWSPRAALPDDDLTEAAGAVLGNKLYVVGGSGRHGVGNVYAYDPVMNTWVTRPVLPTRRLRLAAGVVTDGASARILAVGGLTDANATSAANEAYKP